MTAPSRATVAGVTALLALGLATASAAGHRDGDFVHLWLGGRALVTQGPAALYDPMAHQQILSDTFAGAPPASLWSPRNDTLGAFFYPPPAALAYAPWGALPLHTAGTLHAALAWLGAALAGAIIGRWSRLGWAAGIALTLTTPALLHNHVLGQNGGWTLLVLSIGAAIWASTPPAKDPPAPLSAALLSTESSFSDATPSSKMSIRSALWTNRPLLTGLVWGMLVAKPNWWLSVVWLPFVLGERRMVGGMVLGAFSMCVGSAFVVGLGPWQTYLDRAAELAALSRGSDYPLHLQYSLFGLSRRLLGVGGMGDGVGLLAAGITLAATTWAIRAWRPPRALAIAMGLSAACLVNPHLHPYDVTGGIFALAAVAGLRRHRLLVGLGVLAHHGGQFFEGFGGSGMSLAPATLGLVFAHLMLLWAVFQMRDAPGALRK